MRRVRSSLRYRSKRYLEGDCGNHWCRIVMNDAIDRFVTSLGPEALSAVEISGSFNSRHGWRRYDVLQYPDFDVCEPYDGPQYDVVLCEQVLEHVTDPWAGMRTLHDLARPGGRVVVTTPFLMRIHGAPGDYWRFSPAAMGLLAAGAGLEVIEVGSWGNEGCTKANFHIWRRVLPWNSLHNEPDLPVVVWLFAQRPVR